jgi:hypothetical protein
MTMLRFFYTDFKLQHLGREEERMRNRTYPKVAVQWLNQALYLYQSFCLIKCKMQRNRHLRAAIESYFNYKPTNVDHSKTKQE